MSAIILRRANMEDAALLWKWASDPEVRGNAFQSAEILWESHCEWLQRRLSSNGCRIWILLVDGLPAGQVRYERSGDSADIDISVAAEQRGKGIGTELLRRSTETACNELCVRSVIGWVKAENAVSRKAFERAGFRLAETIERNGRPCVRYELAYTP